VKSILLTSIVALTLSLTCCDNLSRQITTDAPKLVVADGKLYMACAGSVDVQQANLGYGVHLTDRDWNDAKTAYTDTEVYLQARLVTIRPMNNDELRVCQTGHFPSTTQTQTPQTPKTPCEQWREAHPNDTNPCKD
jgi:hypothetical protein